MIRHEINRLVCFALSEGLIEESDVPYTINLIAGTLQLGVFEAEPFPADYNEALRVYAMEDTGEPFRSPAPVLERLLNDAVSRNVIEDTPDVRDAFDTQIMNCLTPRPSEVIQRFRANEAISPQKATDAFYRLGIASDYIRKTRVDANEVWKTSTAYGELDLTINLSKPEKNPKDIERTRLAPSISYPRCLLCRENEGFFGTARHPARTTLRLIPMQLNGESWFFQYSPYGYYNEHCIVLKNKHVPMKISRETFENLFAFLKQMPHYMIGSNADLSIVGGSILNHDHYQGGRHIFPMQMAPIEQEYQLHPEVTAGRVRWPMSVVRLRGGDTKTLVELADHILAQWREYSNPSIELLACTGTTPHNTITPIARMNGNDFELDLVFRNNRASTEHPLGIFHPHAQYHHIKKENIGLIEVMGLAVLPGRLKEELHELEQTWLSDQDSVENKLAIHAGWYQSLRQHYPELCNNPDPAVLHEMFRREIGQVFLDVLLCCGVFKRTPEGNEAFDHFIATLKF